MTTGTSIDTRFRFVEAPDNCLGRLRAVFVILRILSVSSVLDTGARICRHRLDRRGLMAVLPDNPVERQTASLMVRRESSDETPFARFTRSEIHPRFDHGAPVVQGVPGCRGPVAHAVGNLHGSMSINCLLAP